MSSPLGVILNSINSKGEILDREFIEKEYVPFVINRSLSYFQDAVLFVHELNSRPNMPIYDQYLYYFHAIPRGKRFKRWHKTTDDKYLQAVMEYYNYSRQKAEAALELLSDADCQELAKAVSKGGKK